MSDEQSKATEVTLAAPAWSILRSNRTKLTGPKNQTTQRKSSLGVGFYLDSPRFLLYMATGTNKHNGYEVSVTIGMGPLDFALILEAISTVAVAPANSGEYYQFHCKNNRDHRGNTFERPEVVAVFTVSRNQDGAVTIAVQPRDEPLFTFVFGSDFFGHITDQSGEYMPKAKLSELAARAYVKTIGHYIAQYGLLYAKENPKAKGGGGGKSGGYGGGNRQGGGYGGGGQREDKSGGFNNNSRTWGDD